MTDQKVHDPAHRVSYSSLTQHRHCPQRWMYSKVEGLRKIEDDEPAVERDFGSWWHALRAADSIARGRALHSLVALPTWIHTVDNGPDFSSNALNPPFVLDAAKRWYASQSVDVRQEWENRLGGGLVERLLEVNGRWMNRWGSELLNEVPLAVELGWGRDLPIRDGDSDPVRLVGYVDEVYLDKRRGMVVIRDHKTSKVLQTQTTLDDMMDSQLQLYAWGAAPVVKDWGVGNIGATAYDRVRSVKPKTPRLNLDGTLSKSVVDFDLDTYLSWAAGDDGLGRPFPGRLKDGSGKGRYSPEAEVVERLSSPASESAWLQRTLTPLNTNLIKAHLRSAVDTAADMAITEARATVVGEAARNLSLGCKYCDFISLCRYQMIAGPDADYVLADHKLQRRG